jgi:SAM-dependent methyltransferase
MKKTLEEHADRFSEWADEYDESQDSPEYRACANLVVEYADPRSADTVLDLGTGTGAIALALAPAAERVVGRDISEGMLAKAREKADAGGHDNVEFGEGSFRDPNYDGPVDVVVSNFAMHHLSDDEKREAIQVIADLGPRRFVLGDVMFFGTPDPEEPFYSPEVDDPSTVGLLADALTDAGFALTAVEMVHEQVGVLVAENTVSGDDAEGSDDATAQTE